MKTMICLILDRSGSMAGREDDVVGGVNKFLEEQKKLPDPASVALVRFDSEAIERFRPMTELASVTPISRDDFQPRGSTPLLDAVGQTIAALDDDWKREQPERCIVVIVTDGQENCSHEYTKTKLKEMIQARQESGKWAFIYLGANIDSFMEAGSIGVAAANVANYKNTAQGVNAMYGAASGTVAMMRATGQTVATNLGGDIEEDGTVVKTTQTTTGSATTIPPWTPPSTTGSATTTWSPPKP